MAYGDVDSGDMQVASRDGAHAIGNLSMAFAAMLFEGRGIGTLWVGRPVMGTFSDKQLTLLKTFADQAVIAIQNARLFNETREALEQQSASAEVLSVISSSVSDTGPVFEKILDSCQRLFGTDQLCIYTVGDDNVVRTAAWRGSVAEDAGYNETPLEQSITARVIRERRPFYLADVLGEANLPEPPRKRLERLGNVSAVYAPVLWEERGIGSIAVMRQPPKPFTDKELALLQTFADQAAIAIQNARLFNETKEALEQQKASAEILSVISASVADANPVFEKILESCKHLFGGDELDVLLVDEHGLLQVAAYVGKARDTVAATFPAPVDLTPAGRAIRERRVVHYADVLNNLDTPPVLRRMGQILGYHSVAFAPMVWEDRGIGASVAVARHVH
jgi:GAF domain-containing protein